jgi:hypothetical protein
MKFADLYNRVFIKEQEDQTPEITDEVADPSDPDYNVEPAPLPKSPEEPSIDSEPAETQPAIGNTTSLMGYIDNLRKLASSLVDEKNPSQTLIGVLQALDKPTTPYERIGDDQMRSRILQAKTLLSTIADELADYSIKAIKA